MKEELLRLWVDNNPRTPRIWRVNSPQMSNPHFFKAFGVAGL